MAVDSTNTIVVTPEAKQRRAHYLSAQERQWARMAGDVRCSRVPAEALRRASVLADVHATMLRTGTVPVCQMPDAERSRFRGQLTPRRRRKPEKVAARSR